ncbi:MAG TPA: histidine kinase dimerization/phospho-acceptor domain-containing protein, partial [Terriglobales bacterium]|nr:histidine kinase dimerization/phospho-acceptor domain-containing protein [Terriglobales bacterium]
LALRSYEGYLDALVLLGGECLRRVEAVKRAQQAEHSAATIQRQATLGRYMVEMRHSLNNALTSVLGNSELLLMEPGAFSAPVREQIEIIRNMSLRMNEIIQRFSSLESEMKVAEERGIRPPASPKAFAVARG